VTEPSGRTEVKASIMAYAFHGLLRAGVMDIFGYLESVRYRYHLDAADLWSGFFPTLEEDFVRRVGEALVERDLVLVDIAVDHADVWDDDPDAREAFHKRAVRVLEIADTLGARFVRIGSTEARDNPDWTEEEFDFCVKRFREYAQFAYDHGFKMGPENHYRRPEKRWANLKKLYEAVDHPGLGISCHVGKWAGPEEEQAVADAEVAPWVSHTHIDWDLINGDYVQKMLNLHRAGYQGWYSAEHHSGRNEYTEVQIQVDMIRDILNKLRTGEMS
jgi:sugar phosphate isomerase/epimerase